MANNTPAYQGSSNPNAGNGNGWLGRFGNFFGGGGTPVYFGDGQPSSASGSFLGGATPAYKSAPPAKPSMETSPYENASSEQQAMAQAMTACPVDPDPFGSGPIAIIIPRQGF